MSERRFGDISPIGSYNNLLQRSGTQGPSADGASQTSAELKSDLKKLKLGSPLPIIETYSSRQQSFDSFMYQVNHQSALQQQIPNWQPFDSRNSHDPANTESLPPTSPRFMQYHVMDPTQGRPLPEPRTKKSTCEVPRCLSTVCETVES